MNRSKLTAMTVATLLSLSAVVAFAGSSGAPVDKGGMPPSTEMNAGSGAENALPPGTIEGGNGGDANGSSTSPTSPGMGSGSMTGGSSKGSDSGSGAGGSGSSGGSRGSSGGESGE
jgi:hypothetical protein